MSRETVDPVLMDLEQRLRAKVKDYFLRNPPFHSIRAEPLSNENINRITALWRRGMHIKDIARQMHLPQSQVAAIARQYCD